MSAEPMRGAGIRVLIIDDDPGIRSNLGGFLGNRGYVVRTAANAVEDNGPGVPPEIRGKVFDAFYGTKPKGTGLGLSQVFVFAEASGGRAYLADSPVGARFVIELPEATS